jgi:hypothetical protein
MASTPTKNPGTGGAFLSRRQIEGLIADGRSIIIVDQMVLKVDPWLKYHPGGHKAIMHMVGRDATDEVHGYVLLEKLQRIFDSLIFLKTTFRRDKNADAKISNWPDRRPLDKLRASDTGRKVSVICGGRCRHCGRRGGP